MLPSLTQHQRHLAQFCHGLAAALATFPSMSGMAWAISGIRASLVVFWIMKASHGALIMPSQAAYIMTKAGLYVATHPAPRQPRRRPSARPKTKTKYINTQDQVALVSSL